MATDAKQKFEIYLFVMSEAPHSASHITKAALLQLLKLSVDICLLPRVW
jgi:hypothetical protein